MQKRIANEVMGRIHGRLAQSGYRGVDCGLPVTGGCPGGRLGDAGVPPILKFLTASDTTGSDPAGVPIAGDCDESSDG